MLYFTRSPDKMVWKDGDVTTSRLTWTAGELEVEKFNPNHDPETGRFDFGGGSVQVPIGGIRNASAEVLVNPTRRAMLDMARDISRDWTPEERAHIGVDLRGIHEPNGNLYVWNAYDTVHQVVAESLGLSRHSAYDTWTVQGGRIWPQDSQLDAWLADAAKAPGRVAKLIIKFNEHHDELGRFAEGPGFEGEATGEPEHTDRLMRSEDVIETGPEEFNAGFLSPRGALLEITSGDSHESVANKAGTTLDDLMDEGTARVYASDDFLGIDISRRPTANQMSALFDLAKKGKFERFAIEGFRDAIRETLVTPRLIKEEVDRAFPVHLAKYNPYHEPAGSPEGGQFTSGPGLTFASPSVTHQNFTEAQQAVHGARQAAFRGAMYDVDAELGMRGVTSDAIGAWRDGAENSTLSISRDVDWDTLKASAAMKGWLANQKSVLVFKEGAGGDHYLASFHANGGLEDIHRGLLAAGIENHTLSPSGNGAAVWLYGKEQADLDRAANYAQGLGGKLKVRLGHGEFIGTELQDVGDRAERKDARRVYEAIITDSAQRDGGRAVRAWSRIRNRYGQSLDAIKRAVEELVKYNENHDERGRFTFSDGDVSGMVAAAEAAGHKVYWHGSASGDLRGGTSGLHLGTKEAATVALEARIGIPADGKGWTGNREYGKTLLAGKDTLAQMAARGVHGGYPETGFNAGRSDVELPKRDFYPADYFKEHPSEHPRYPDGSLMPLSVKPSVEPYVISGPMTNTPNSPHSDIRANALMRGQITRGGTGRRGYFYREEGEDTGSIAAVVPNGKHVTHLRDLNLRKFNEHHDEHGRFTFADGGGADTAHTVAAAVASGKTFYHGTARGNLGFREGGVAYFSLDRKLAQDYANMDAEVEGGRPAVIGGKLTGAKIKVLDNMLMQDLHLPEHQSLVKEMLADGYSAAVGRGNDVEIAVLRPDIISVVHDDLRKFNPNHDERGRFAEGDGVGPSGETAKITAKLGAKFNRHSAKDVARYGATGYLSPHGQFFDIGNKAHEQAAHIVGVNGVDGMLEKGFARMWVLAGPQELGRGGQLGAIGFNADQVTQQQLDFIGAVVGASTPGTIATLSLDTAESGAKFEPDTGLTPSNVREFIESKHSVRKFNENHDPETGRFTFGDGGDEYATREPPVRLYRGDSAKIGRYDTEATKLNNLFGRGIYLTDNKRVAGDYTSTGETEQGDVLFRYRGSGKLSRQEVVDAYVDRMARTFDAKGVDHSGEMAYWTHDVPFSSGRDWSYRGFSDADDAEREKRLGFAREKWDELKNDYGVRVKLDGTAVIQRLATAANVSAFDIPKSVLDHTLNADEEIPHGVQEALESALHSSGDHATARDISNYIRGRERDFESDGGRPTFREVYTGITSNSPLTSDEAAQGAFRQALSDLGYTGIRYTGGVTMGGGYRHNAYVLWDSKLVNRYRSVRKFNPHHDELGRFAEGPGAGAEPVLRDGNLPSQSIMVPAYDKDSRADSPVEVLVNPSDRDAHDLMMRDHEPGGYILDCLRMVRDVNANVYVWHGIDAIHADMEGALIDLSGGKLSRGSFDRTTRDEVWADREHNGLTKYTRSVLARGRENAAKAVAKFNPNHDELGRFAEGGLGGGSMSTGRADAGGLTPVYHGTTASFGALGPPTGERWNMLDRMLGIHVAKDPDVANTFVTDWQTGEPKEGGRVLPLRLDDSKFLTVPQERYGSGALETDQNAIERMITAEGYRQDPAMLARYLEEARRIPRDEAATFANDLAAGKRVDMSKYEGQYGKDYTLDRLVKNFLGGPHNEGDRRRIVQLARDAWESKGYQGLRYTNTSPMETGGTRGVAPPRDKTSYVVFKPASLRSRFEEPLVKFNPNHEPAGSPEGGQFAEGPGGGDGSFTDSERKMFKEYTATEGSNKLNKFYRASDKSKYSEKTRKELTAKIDAINAALKKNQLASDATLYRAIAPCKVATELNKDHNAEKLVGQTMPLGGFQSTTTKWGAAVNYAEKSGANIIMVMDVPAKTPAINMKPFSSYKRESEMLLGQGEFTVTGVRRKEGDDGGVIMIFGKYAASGP